MALGQTNRHIPIHFSSSPVPPLVWRSRRQLPTLTEVAFAYRAFLVFNCSSACFSKFSRQRASPYLHYYHTVLFLASIYQHTTVIACKIRDSTHPNLTSFWELVILFPPARCTQVLFLSLCLLAPSNYVVHLCPWSKSSPPIIRPLVVVTVTLAFSAVGITFYAYILRTHTHHIINIFCVP